MKDENILYNEYHEDYPDKKSGKNLFVYFLTTPEFPCISLRKKVEVSIQIE